MATNDEVAGPELEHYISEGDVREASELAAKGQQRLRDISDTQTLFHFPVDFEGHFAAVQLSVSVIWKEDSPYPLYETEVHYRLCCDTAFADEVYKSFQSRLQLVYDTYIRPVRRRLDKHCCKRTPARIGVSESCQEQKSSYIQWLNRRRDLETEESPEYNHSTTGESTQGLQRNTPVQREKRRHDGDHNHEHSNAGNDADDDNDSFRAVWSEGNTAKRQHLEGIEQQLAEALVKKAKTGILRIQQHRGKQQQQKGLPSSGRIMNIISRLHERDHGLEDVNSSPGKLLEQLEQEFLVAGKSKKAEANIEVWTNWYFFACIRTYRYHWNSDQYVKDQHTDGVYVLHLIISELFVTEGPRSLILINAFAILGHHLAKVARRSRESQRNIAKLVAISLQKERILIDPPNQFIVPLPAVWVSLVMGISYREACISLGIPALATLQMKPIWLQVGSPLNLSPGVVQNWILALGSPYLEVVERWDSFAQMRSRLYLDLEQTTLNWGQMEPKAQFEKAVLQWCEDGGPRREQHPWRKPGRVVAERQTAPPVAMAISDPVQLTNCSQELFETSESSPALAGCGPPTIASSPVQTELAQLDCSEVTSHYSSSAFMIQRPDTEEMQISTITAADTNGQRPNRSDVTDVEPTPQGSYGALQLCQNNSPDSILMPRAGEFQLSESSDVMNFPPENQVENQQPANQESLTTNSLSTNAVYLRPAASNQRTREDTNDTFSKHLRREASKSASPDQNSTPTDSWERARRRDTPGTDDHTRHPRSPAAGTTLPAEVHTLHAFFSTRAGVPLNPSSHEREAPEANEYPVTVTLSEATEFPSISADQVENVTDASAGSNPQQPSAHGVHPNAPILEADETQGVCQGDTGPEHDDQPPSPDEWRTAFGLDPERYKDHPPTGHDTSLFNTAGLDFSGPSWQYPVDDSNAEILFGSQLMPQQYATIGFPSCSA